MVRWAISTRDCVFIPTIMRWMFRTIFIFKLYILSINRSFHPIWNDWKRCRVAKQTQKVQRLHNKVLLTRKKTDANAFAGLWRPRKTVYGALCAPWFSLLPTTTRSTDASNEDNWWCWLSACRPRASSRPSRPKALPSTVMGEMVDGRFRERRRKIGSGLFMYKEWTSLYWALFSRMILVGVWSLVSKLISIF